MKGWSDLLVHSSEILWTTLKHTHTHTHGQKLACSKNTIILFLGHKHVFLYRKNKVHYGKSCFFLVDLNTFTLLQMDAKKWRKKLIQNCLFIGKSICKICLRRTRTQSHQCKHENKKSTISPLLSSCFSYTFRAKQIQEKKCECHSRLICFTKVYKFKMSEFHKIIYK